MAIVLRLVQQYQHSKKQEFMALEKQFAELEERGILPRGERLAPITSREPGNTVVWQARFENFSAVEAALQLFETNPEHTELANQQKHFFESSWVELYEVIEY